MKKIATKIFTPVILLVLIIFTAIILFSFHQASQAKSAAALVAHSHEVMFQTSRILSLIKDNETGSRGYLLTGNKSFLEPLNASKKKIYPEIDILTRLTADNPSQQLRIDSLTYFTKQRMAFSDSTIKVRDETGLPAAIRMISNGDGKLYMDSIQSVVSDMQEEEQQLLQARKIGNEKAGILLNRIIISIIAVIGVLLLIFASKDYLQLMQRKSVEDTLKKNEAMLYLMTNNIKDIAIFMLDKNGFIMSWNRGAETVLGYEKQEMIGKSFTVFYEATAIKNDEPQRNLGLATKYGQYETEGRRVKKGGRVFWANVIFTALVNDSGDSYGFSSIVRDITERKKTAEQVDFLSRQINHSNDAIFVVDSERRIKSWNKGAENLYGFNIKEVLDKDANEVLRTNLSKEEIEVLLRKIAIQDHWTGEIKRSTKAGNQITVHSSTSTIRDSLGDITGYVAVSFDIGDQILLRERVNYLASLVEQSSEAIISVNLTNAEILSWNSGAERLFGYTAKDVADTAIDAIPLVCSNDDRFYQLTQKVLAHGSVNTEMQLAHKNGILFHGVVNGNIIRNEKNENTSVVFLINDISVRKELEERLRKSNEELELRVKERTDEITKNEQRYRALIEHSAEGIALLDETGSIFYRSPAAYRITGELSLGNAMGSIHPEDTDLIKLKGYEALQQPSAPVQWQGRFKLADGVYAWMEGTFTNLLHVDGVNAIVANYRNITDRKYAEGELVKSEHLYRNLFENMQHGFAYCKGEFSDGKLIDYKFLNVNNEFETQTGLKAVTGKNISDISPEILRANNKYLDILAGVALEAKTAKFETYSEVLQRWLAVSLYSTEKEYFVVLVDNITERKKQEHKIKNLNTELEERVSRRTDQLKKSNEELEAFSYSVSHDLRAPLRAIIGFTNVLEDEYSSQLDDEAQRITSIIKANTLKMGHLIDDLLAFSRMGRTDIIKTHIDTDMMVRDIIHSPEIKQYDLQNPVNWVVHDLPNIDADANTLRQVWINLISNAAKYSNKSVNPTIEIDFYQKDTKIIFFIKDNGVGFDEKYKNKLFRVFQRLHSADEFEGTGIGLAIVEKIISKHNGQVWVQAQQGKGATFYFSLPDNGLETTAHHQLQTNTTHHES